MLGILLLALYFAAPVAVSALVARSARSRPLRTGAVCAALFTVAYEAVFVLAIFANTSSTSGIALLFLPLPASAVFVAGFGVGWAGAHLAEAYLMRPGLRRSVLPAIVAASILCASGIVGVFLARFVVLDHRAGAADTHPDQLRAVLQTWNARRELYETIAGLLGRSANTHPLSRLALNPSTPEEVLVALARDSNGSVVWRALDNPRMGEESLAELYSEGDPRVRRSLARNPNTPVEILRELAESDDPHLDLMLAMHPKLPEELRLPLLERLVRTDNQYLRNSVAAQPTMPPHLLRVLADDEWELVRRTVAANRSTPRDVVERLASDSDEEVRRMARHVLESRGAARGPE